MQTCQLIDHSLAKRFDGDSEREPLPEWDYPGSPLLESLARLNDSPRHAKTGDAHRSHNIVPKELKQARPVLGDVTNITKPESGKRVVVRPKKSRTQITHTVKKAIAIHKELPVVPESSPGKQQPLTSRKTDLNDQRNILLEHKRATSAVIGSHSGPDTGEGSVCRLGEIKPRESWRDLSNVANGSSAS